MISLRYALVLALCLAAGPFAVGDESVFPYERHVETLDNGLKVIIVPMDSEGLVSYWSIVRTGSRDEYEPGRSGFAHFFEHMMFRGTDKYPSEEYERLVTTMGADSNAYTTDDLTAYHLAVATEDLPTVIDIESDRFQNLNYSLEAFQTESGAVYGEYRKNRANPFFSLYEKIRETAFTKHTYGHTTMGYERDIKKMPQLFDYSRSFFERYYRPENVIILVAGDLDAKETLATIKRHYGSWSAGYVAPEVQEEPTQEGERRATVHYEGRSLPILWAAYKMDAFDPKDKVRVAADLLADLAFGETSAVYKKLVLDEQVVEFLAADPNMNRDPGLFDIITRVKDPEKVDYVLEEIEQTIAHYRENLADEKRLEGLKSRKKYQFVMGLDTPDNLCSRLARTVAITGGLDAIDHYYETMQQITAEDIKAAAQAYLDVDRRTVATLWGKK